MANLKNTTIQGTSHLGLPVGTTAQRPVVATGQLRVNSDKNLIEGYNNAGWRTDSGWIVVHTPGQTGAGPGFRQSPAYTPQVLIQVESVGLNNVNTDYRQFIQINGSTVLSANSPRSYRLTKLRKNANGFWTYIESYGYDVYGSTVEAQNAKTFLETFVTGDLLVLNTWDEPRNNSSIIMPTLRDRFGSKIYSYQSQWTDRDMHALISIRGSRKPLFEEHRPSPQGGIEVSMWLP